MEKSCHTLLKTLWSVTCESCHGTYVRKVLHDSSMYHHGSNTCYTICFQFFSCFPCRSWNMSHVTEWEWVMSRSGVSMSYASDESVMSHMNDSCHISNSHIIYKWVMSHIYGLCRHMWMSHVTKKSVMSPLWKSRVVVWQSRVTNVKESCRNQDRHCHCNTLQQTATHCNTLQQTATQCNNICENIMSMSRLSGTATHTATHFEYCNTHCNTLQHTTPQCTSLQHTTVKTVSAFRVLYHTLQHTATPCNTLQHSAPHCNTLLSRPSVPFEYCNTHCNTLQHIAIHYNTLQRTATYCNTLQHTTFKTKQCLSSDMTHVGDMTSLWTSSHT